MSARVDLVSVNLDNVAAASLRTDEELKKYTLEESLECKPVEKCVHLLTSGEDVQKISVIMALTELYKSEPSGCLQKIIPKIQQNLSGGSADYHMSYCNAIKSLMEEKIMPIDTFAGIFLPSILIGIEHRDSQVVDAWVECLISLIPSLPMGILMKEIKPLAIGKAAPTKPVYVRTQSCRIIGALCRKLPLSEVDKELIPVIVPLWRDPSPEVRSSMIRQLPFIVRVLGGLSDSDYIIGPFVQLVSDELPKVAEVAFAAMVASIPYFSVDHLRESIWPLLREIIIQAFKFDHNLLLVVAEQYGKMVTGLERAIPASEKDIYVKHYISLLEKSSDKQSRMGRNKMGPELSAACRKHCAANYKDMAKFAYNENNKILLDQLHLSLGELINDHFWECRKTIASSMYDIILIYGKYSQILKKEVNTILNDSLVEVIDGLLPHLAEILVNFVKSGYYHKDQTEPNTSELLKSLEKCETTLLSGYNWRAYCKFMNQMEVMWYIFTPDVVYNRFVDLWFKRLINCKVLKTKLALIRTIMVNLKYIPRAFYKAEAKNKIIDLSTSPNFYDRMLFIRSIEILTDIHSTVFFKDHYFLRTLQMSDLSTSPNFYDRMLFIRSIEILTDIHSTVFFKDHYFLRTLQMSDDNVANIRWAVCCLLPKLQAMIRMPDDKVLLNILDDVMQHLTVDKDKEVQEMMKTAKTDIETSRPMVFLSDNKNYEEERLLQNLSAKQIQSFPESVVSLLEPSVLGIGVAHRDSKEISGDIKGKGANLPRRQSARSNRSTGSSSSTSSNAQRGRTAPAKRNR